MLFRQKFLDGIRSGVVTLAFRRWTRPSVRAGGTLITPAGQLEIGAVTTVSESEITDEDARCAGYAERADLVADLGRRPGRIYRVELAALRPDPRVALRAVAPDDVDTAEVLRTLRRLDRHPAGAWTRRVLDVIARRPSVRAGDLCELVGMEKPIFKLNVRKLKTLGLTESLPTGYRLSPRGEAVLARVAAGEDPSPDDEGYRGCHGGLPAGRIQQRTVPRNR